MIPRAIRRRSTLGIAASTLTLGLVLAAWPAAAQKETLAEYTANAVVLGLGPQGASTIVNIRIQRWSTDEDRAVLLEAIKASGSARNPSREVSRALRRQDRAGTIWITGQRGYPLRYARMAESGGRQQIVVATDRPVTFAEVYRGSQAREFDVTLIALQVGEDGTGKGVANVGAEVKWNEETERLEITNFSAQPIQLTSVEQVK